MLILLRLASSFEDAKYCVEQFQRKAHTIGSPFDGWAREMIANFLCDQGRFHFEEQKQLAGHALQGYLELIWNLGIDDSTFADAVCRT